MIKKKLFRFIKTGKMYLILQVNWSIEVWDLRIDRFADHFTFTSVHERTHFYRNQKNP